MLSKRAFAEHPAEGVWPAQSYLQHAAKKEEDPHMGVSNRQHLVSHRRAACPPWPSQSWEQGVSLGRQGGRGVEVASRALDSPCQH